MPHSCQSPPIGVLGELRHVDWHVERGVAAHVRAWGRRGYRHGPAALRAPLRFSHLLAAVRPVSLVHYFQPFLPLWIFGHLWPVRNGVLLIVRLTLSHCRRLARVSRGCVSVLGVLSSALRALRPDDGSHHHAEDLRLLRPRSDLDRPELAAPAHLAQVCRPGVDAHEPPEPWPLSALSVDLIASATARRSSVRTVRPSR